MFLLHDIGASGRSASDDFWYMPVGTLSAAGKRVTPETAMRLSTVYKCVRVIAETVGMLPMLVYQRLADGGKERASEHPLAALLHDAPNPWQTAMQWREMMQGHATLRGAGYSRIVYSGAGRVDMLVPMHPDRVTVEVVRPDRPPRFRYQRPEGGEEVLVWGEVLYLAGMSSDGFRALSPIEMTRETLGAAMSTREYGARFFANDARAPGWIEVPGKFADETAARKFRESYQMAQTGPNKGKTPVFDRGMKYHELTVKNNEAEFVATHKLQDTDIAGIFRVPPHKIGILDQAKWANIEQQALEFVTDCIMPWAVRWEQCLLRDLEFGEGYFPELLLDMLLRGDTKSRYEAYGKGIQDGWLLRNEARAKENLNPLPGLDTPLEPMNMAPAGSRRAQQERGQPPDAQQRLGAERAFLIQQAAAARVVRKEVAALQKATVAADVDAALAEMFAEHQRFVAEVMGASTAEAEAYCAAGYARALNLHLAKQLATFSVEQWTDERTAALMRLGEN